MTQSEFEFNGPQSFTDLRDYVINLSERLAKVEDVVNRTPRKRDELTDHAQKVLEFLKSHSPLKFNVGAISHNMEMDDNLVNSAVGSLISRNLIQRMPIHSHQNRNKPVTHRTKYSYWFEEENTDNA